MGDGVGRLGGFVGSVPGKRRQSSLKGAAHHDMAVRAVLKQAFGSPRRELGEPPRSPRRGAVPRPVSGR